MIIACIVKDKKLKNRNLFSSKFLNVNVTMNIISKNIIGTSQ